MLQCSDILHRTAINFQISYLKLNTNILHIADSSSKSLIQYIYIIISFVYILYDFFLGNSSGQSLLQLFIQNTQRRGTDKLSMLCKICPLTSVLFFFYEQLALVIVFCCVSYICSVTTKLVSFCDLVGFLLYSSWYCKFAQQSTYSSK